MFAGNGFILFLCISEAILGISHKGKGDLYIPLGIAKKNAKQSLAVKVVQAIRLIMAYGSYIEYLT